MICDLAETYRIYDWRQVPIKLLGIYAAGLRWDSRVMMERMGEDFSLDTLMTASIADSLRGIIYGLFSKKGSEKPNSFVEALTRKKEQKAEVAFRSGDDFMEARARLLQEIDNNG